MSAVLEPVMATTPAAASRHNIYTVIHKALRAFMADTLVEIGRMDPADDGECTAALEQLRALLDACSSHLHHENAFVHPAIDKAFPGRSAHTAAEHVQHEAEIAALAQAAERVAALPAGRRAGEAQALYLQLSGFIGENLAHMIVEETENHAALVAGYSEQEVLGIEQALVASLSPEEKFIVLRWMIPHCNANERAFLLGGMQRHAPAPAFQAALGLARDSLTQRDFFKLERALAA